MRHEIIKFNSNLPIKLVIHKVGNVGYHWHQSLEIILVLKGSISVFMGDRTYKLNKNDIILINSNVLHSIYGENAILIVLQIKLDSFDNISADIKKVKFDVISNEDNSNKFDIIRNILAKIIKANEKKSTSNELINLSLVYSLLFELYDKFSTTEEIISRSKLDRLTSLLTYINSNYKNDISLDDLANQFYLSHEYLSRYFKANVGDTFSNYLKNIRLTKAINLLENDDLSLEEIAIQAGFKSTRSFVSAFKDKYNEIPSIYRKKIIKEKNETLTEFIKDKSFNYLDEPMDNYFDYVNDFVDKYLQNTKFDIKTKTPSKLGVNTVNMTNVIGENPKYYKNLIGMSRAKDILNFNVQQQLIILQKEIGFKNIKLHSIFDDDMMVLSKINNKYVYNFTMIDMVYDFLLSINLTPLVQLSFMPSAIASEKNKTIFLNKTNTSEPSDINIWCNLVKNFITHLISRYGINKVKTFMFTVWNEPSTLNLLFGFKNDTSYFNLYKATYTTIKNISNDLKVGGPASFETWGKDSSWLLHFLKYTKENKITPDFITIHYYDIDLSYIDDEKMMKENHIFLSPYENSFNLFLKNINQILKNNDFDQDIYLTEWNNTVSHQDLTSDTCFKGTYIIKNILENYNSIKCFGYWLVSDLNEENLLPNKTFHGGLGLFTKNGIKKPSYYAFYFLNQLGSIVIDYKNNYFITKDEFENYQILLYNYHHFTKEYIKEIKIGVTDIDRYQAFDDIHNLNINLHLDNIFGEYLVEHEYVNRTSGSAFDISLSLGDIDSLNIDPNYINIISTPKKEFYSIKAEKTYELNVKLEPFEFRLIKLKKIR